DQHDSTVCTAGRPAANPKDRRRLSGDKKLQGKRLAENLPCAKFAPLTAKLQFIASPEGRSYRYRCPMSLSPNPSNEVMQAWLQAHTAGIDVDLRFLEAHVLVAGNPLDLVEGLIFAQ